MTDAKLLFEQMKKDLGVDKKSLANGVWTGLGAKLKAALSKCSNVDCQRDLDKLKDAEIIEVRRAARQLIAEYQKTIVQLSQVMQHVQISEEVRDLTDKNFKGWATLGKVAHLIETSLKKAA